MPLPFFRPNGRHAMVSSAALVRPRDQELVLRARMPWQTRALVYYRSIGEVRFASHFYSRMMKRLRIYPALRDPSTERGEQIKSGMPVELLDQIQDPGGGRSKLFGDYGRLMFVTGEGCLFGKRLNSPEENWSFVWNGEVEQLPNGSIKHEPMPGQITEYGPGEAVLYRMWTPAPERSGMADSPMQSVQDVCEELLLLTKSVRSTAVSRLARAGILFMPIEIAPPPAEGGADEDPEQDIFITSMIDHFSRQIEDTSAAESHVPLVPWVQGEHIANIKHVKTHDSTTDYMEKDLRREAIQRLALGFDMPPEELLGMADANHWTAWQIKDSTWASHGAPIADQFCDDLNEAYLRPALREAGYANWDRVVIEYDAAEVVLNPDVSEDANQAYDRGAISLEYYRKMLNIPEEAKPSDEEYQRWLDIKTKGQSRQSPREIEPRDDQPGRGDPEGGVDNVREREGRAASGALMEFGAAAHALWRCRELAGIRIRQKEKVCPDCVARANGHPNAMVAALVGAEALVSIGVQPQILVRGGADTFRSMMRDWGYTAAQSEALAEQVELYAARTLFDERQPTLPAGFATTLGDAREALGR